MTTTRGFLLLLGILVAAPAYAGDVPCKQLHTLKSVSYDTPTTTNFHNATGERRFVFWIDYEGKPQKYGPIGPGETMEQQTFKTHPFAFTDQKGVCKEIFVMTAKHRNIDLTR